MKNRIADLLNDNRLDDLMVTPEFRLARQRLFFMLKRLSNGDQISDEDMGFVEYAEKHIVNIDRHWVTGVVDGQPQQYLRITKE